jgi:YD repeat-containing protein
MINPVQNVVKVESSMEKCNVIRATSVFNKKNEFDWTANGRLIEIELVETTFNHLTETEKNC